MAHVGVYSGECLEVEGVFIGDEEAFGEEGVFEGVEAAAALPWECGSADLLWLCHADPTLRSSVQLQDARAPCSTSPRRHVRPSMLGMCSLRNRKHANARSLIAWSL